ncbi:MAG TPA: hypothetical protein VNH83_20790 [Bryobacteraceae bacterium]|nr:hypothetical protein [Bryobacteraceae bacterium]
MRAVESGEGSGDKGIYDADAFEAGEVAVGGPELTDAVQAGDGQWRVGGLMLGGIFAMSVNEGRPT